MNFLLRSFGMRFCTLKECGVSKKIIFRSLKASILYIFNYFIFEV